jgi:hypothetical protein
MVSGAHGPLFFRFKSGNTRGRRSKRLARRLDAALGNRPICIINFDSFNSDGRAHTSPSPLAKFNVATTHVGTSRASGNAPSSNTISHTTHPLGFRSA